MPVYGTMTCEEVAKELESEFNMLHDHLEHDHTPEEMNLWEQFIADLKSRGSEIFVEETQFDDMDEDDMEDVSPAYLYFALIDPVFRNGLTFLNS